MRKHQFPHADDDSTTIVGTYDDFEKTTITVMYFGKIVYFI